MEKVRIYRMLLRLSAAVLFIGILFRIMHWPYGQAMEIVAFSSLGVTSFLFYSSKLEKSYLDELAMIGLPLLAVHAVLKILHAPYLMEITLGLGIIAVLYFAYIGFKWYQIDKKNGVKRFNVQRAAYILGGIVICVGMLFKIQYWPGGRMLLLSGIGLLFLSFFFPKDKTD